MRGALCKRLGSTCPHSSSCGVHSAAVVPFHVDQSSVFVTANSSREAKTWFQGHVAKFFLKHHTESQQMMAARNLGCHLVELAYFFC
jgi:hypothetical protein